MRVSHPKVYVERQGHEDIKALYKTRWHRETLYPAEDYEVGWSEGKAAEIILRKSWAWKRRMDSCMEASFGVNGYETISSSVL